MLGVWIVPSGNKKGIKELKPASVTWGGKMRIGSSSPEEVWTAIHTHISVKLKHPVPTYALSEKECKSIIYRSIRAALPRARVASNVGTLFCD